MGRDAIGALQKQQIPQGYESAGTMAGNPYNPTLRERLTAQQGRLTQQLADVTAAIEALDKNPNFEQVLDVIGKAQY
jgi:dienelactone hydrolase